MGGKLRARSSYCARPETMSDISMVVLGLMQFENFSDSRWLGAEPACRCLLRSMMVGLESLVAFVRRDRLVSEYFISGFGKLSAKSRRFIGVASVVSYVPEAFQIAILEDPWIPLRIEALESIVQEGAAWVWNTPLDFWQKISAVLGCLAGKIRHAAMSAVMVCLGFLERRVFRAAREAPWNLCIGDSIDENLNKLVMQEKPREDTTAKIWSLLRLNYPRQQLVLAIRLMQSCAWSIGLNEQMHAQQAALKKLHHGYGRRTLAARSFVALLKPLLAPSPQANDSKS